MINVLVKSSLEPQRKEIAQIILQGFANNLVSISKERDLLIEVLSWENDEPVEKIIDMALLKLPYKCVQSNALVIIPEPEESIARENITNVKVTALSPEPFSQIGLCFWKTEYEQKLRTELHAFEFHSLHFSDVRVLLDLVIGLASYIQGDFQKAISCYEEVAKCTSFKKESKGYIFWWLGLAHLGHGQIFGLASSYNKAIKFFTQALSILGHDSHSVIVAAIHRSLARAFSLMPSDRSFELCQKGLKQLELAHCCLNVQAYPVEWGHHLYDRASIYLYMPKAKESSALQHAFTDLENALHIFDKERFPVEYAQCQNALGRLHSDWHQENRLEHQRMAHICFVEALEIRRREKYPWQYAQTQHNLGTLLLQSLEGEEDDNIATALFHLDEAFTVFKKSNFPYRYVQTVAALGRAYLRQHILGKNTLERARLYAEEAFTMLSSINSTYLYAQACYDLGNIFGADQNSELFSPDKAIQYYRYALDVFCKENFPADHAKVLIAIGGILLSSKLNHETMREALVYYFQALEIFNFREFPYEYGCIQTTIGTLYFSLANCNIKLGKELTNKGIAHYKQALLAFSCHGYQNELSLVQDYLEEAFAELGNVISP